MLTKEELLFNRCASLLSLQVYSFVHHYHHL